MLKEKAKNKIYQVLTLLLIVFILYIFPKADKTIPVTNQINKEEYIYVLDNNNYASRIGVILNNKKNIDKIKEIISYLTINTKESSYLKKGFKSIIPQNTKLLSITDENNIITLNFSKELLNIEEKNEEKMISSIIYSITEINKDYKVSFYVNNTPLINLPNSKNKLPNIIDRTYGINNTYNIDNINNINKTTVYYLSKNDEYYYYIPITYINNKKDNKAKIIIEELASKSVYQTNLISYIKNVNKITYEEDNDILTINLNSNNFISDNLIEETINTISLSLKEIDNKFVIKIDNQIYKYI